MPQLKIPAWLPFSDLALEVEQRTGLLLYDPGPLMELCRVNGRDPIETVADEDQACALIGDWYCVHREASGQADSVAELSLADVAAWEAISVAASRPVRRPWQAG